MKTKSDFLDLLDLDLELIRVLKLTEYEYNLVFKWITVESKLKFINSNIDKTPERIVK